MIPLQLQRLFRAVLGGFLIGSSLIGYAQDDVAGVVRITDARPRGVPARNASFGGQHLPGQYHPVGHGHGYGHGGGYYGDGCPDCEDDCDHGHHAKCRRIFSEHYCKLAPDHGFSIPAKTPIYRRGVQYNQYFPGGWYGTPGGGIAPGHVYPTIYQPTDTTQLGFYYQHVPFWTPNPNALPPRPIPYQWHTLLPPAQPHWCRHGWGAGYAGSCPPGSWSEGAIVNPGLAPTNQTTPTPAQAPPSTDAPPVPVQDDSAPPPPNEAAQSQQIRRANFQE